MKKIIIMILTFILTTTVLTYAAEKPDLPDVGDNILCEHKNIKEINVSSKRESIKNDNEYHSLIETYDEKCNDCDEIVSKNKTKTTKEKHSFSNNKCTTCGYEKKCAHTNTKTVVLDKKEIKAIDNDNINHLVLSYTKKQCTSCQEYIGEEIPSETKEMHTFINEVCIKCNYKKPDTKCKHEDKSKIVTEENKKYSSIDDDNDKHLLIIETQQKCTNTNCNTLIGEKTSSEQKEAHEYVNETCTKCGYKKTVEECKHTDDSKIVNEENTNYTIINGDDEYHMAIVESQQKCNLCNSFVSEKTFTEVKEKHEFNKDTCSVCGYVILTDDSELSKAIEFLKENEIMVGDANGDFRANDDMTRAEYAKIICTYVGDAYVNVSITNSFDDVSENHWAYGYIMKANQSGLLLGYGNGIFGCDDTLTEEQAVTVICRMLGDTYEDVKYIETSADENGGYSDGYISIAGERGINIEGLQKKVPATRARVAKWLYQLYSIKNTF